MFQYLRNPRSMRYKTVIKRLKFQQKSRLDMYDHTDDVGKVAKLELSEQDFTSVDDVVQTLESFNATEVSEQSLSQHNLQVSLYQVLDESYSNISTFIDKEIMHYPIQLMF